MWTPSLKDEIKSTGTNLVQPKSLSAIFCVSGKSSYRIIVPILLLFKFSAPYMSYAAPYMSYAAPYMSYAAPYMSYAAPYMSYAAPYLKICHCILPSPRIREDD